MADTVKNDEWHCGGWEGAELEQLRTMAALTFAEKIQWLEDAQKLASNIKGWRRSQGLPSITQNGEIEW